MTGTAALGYFVLGAIATLTALLVVVAIGSTWADPGVVRDEDLLDDVPAPIDIEDLHD